MPTALHALNRSVRLAVLISGGGTTLMNLLEKNRAGQLDAEFPIVIASKEDCSGVERARNAGLTCEPVVRTEFNTIETFSERIFDLCRKAEVDMVVLGGFLSLVQVPVDFENKVINIHPSLIPAFCGKGFHGRHVHEAVLARGAKVSGCTVHFANNEYDAGPIILQKVVPVMDDDTPDTLQKRVFEAECEAFPEAIRMFTSGRLTIDRSRVVTS
ncbi:MAG: phosphoribosylglycinamide formyltransferase [Planctomycetaceae bacterium]|jgi:formyltetrahydrofolate-dependent phosphoribosylglycinamide formyltransferase|nr:phosphoribosylglycinamide formyltransferase [Planctomycetaceae bacterium]